MVRKIDSVRLALALPLIGLVATWVTFMLSAYSDQFLEQSYYTDSGEWMNPTPAVQLSTYLILLGITAFAASALLGQRIAISERAKNDSALAITAHRFTNLAVILSLVAGAVYAIGTFLGAFNTYDSRDASVLIRIFGVYVPIILATALVVFVLLFAFVFRNDAPDLPHSEKDNERDALQRAIGLAYAVPVIGTAIAIIFGLAVYDTTRTNLDVWIWVIIQVIIASSIILGTRFAARARLAKPLPVRPRRTGAAAVNLNLVLSIIFGATVTLMSFTYGFSAIESLRIWPEWVEGATDMQLQPTLEPVTLEWLLRELAPALVLLALAAFGVYRSMIVRNGQADKVA
ncbi:hypothetical protein [Candidatus Aquiluna sp. UB-MaderosW2red]|uniref:hypothetical protein n=1 Tax=Candidatus Aquiluna sp. UB-MaderosW2red TaxID=1855377 RepID=UPI000875D412|nr:hypothetical protein [Candidatus Aquiluna sp. UB-MaderosW2red]SCX15512.1 hypothetical protein SAMN05216534_1665 [Candidatus Aquiluna sp. UB-MaderosW2red]